VEVLKGLHALSRVRPLPQKERELYDNARHLLVGEIAAAMNIPLHVAEDNLDYALWPPEGMKRKGKPLPPATLGPPSPARVVSGDDDLGLDDEELETVETVLPVAAPAEEPEEEPEEAEEKPVAPAAKKAAEKEKPKTAHRHEAPAAKKQKPSHPPAKKAAPPKKAAAKKPAAKHAPKKAAPAKRPAAKASAKGKR